MKRICDYIIILFILIGFTATGFSQDMKLEEPVLLTAAGQSADIKITDILLKRAGITANVVNLAEVKDLTDIKTLIIVAGGSSKGLGAANIDKDKELERISNLAEAAKKENIKTLTLHIGGKTRRGKLSDPFCETAGNAADLLIVTKSGNEDGFFTKIAAAKKINIHEIKNSPEMIPILTGLFEKK